MLQVLTELKALYDELPPQVQRDIKVSKLHVPAPALPVSVPADGPAPLPHHASGVLQIVELPMASTHDNATMVNAIQRSSLVIVQNSLREGFGLTATEAIFKRVCFVGTAQAVGLRTQIRHGMDGVLVQGDPSEPRNVAAALNLVLGNPSLRDRLAVNGQKRAYDSFLLYTQLHDWVLMISKMTGVWQWRCTCSLSRARA